MNTEDLERKIRAYEEEPPSRRRTPREHLKALSARFVAANADPQTSTILGLVLVGVLALVLGAAGSQA